MTAISHWMHVDLFKVDQAAALWAGFDPARVSSVEAFKPSEVIATYQMLVSAITTGELMAQSQTNIFAQVGDFRESLVARVDLEAFARRRNLFPAFLFDTLAPLASMGGLPTNDVPRLHAMDGLPASPQPNRGGRPPEHDWNSFTLEIIRRANHPDGLPDTQAQLVRDMLEWFGRIYNREPADSLVKERISKIYAYLAAAGNS